MIPNELLLLGQPKHFRQSLLAFREPERLIDHCQVMAAQGGTDDNLYG
jgi:hypothetical protein